MARYRLTRRAENDLLDIFLFGLEQFGDVQAQRYQAGFEECFRMLAENPLLGRSAHAIAPALRRHEHGSHVVLYEQDADGILIVAVLYGRSLRGLTV
ncbi:type II toxin-antitoxin system RelE/ParE family toxin [Methylobacterium iners]